MEYIIVNAANEEHFKALKDLAVEVNRAIQDGFRPSGNHCVVFEPRGARGGFRASQAMVKGYIEED